MPGQPLDDGIAHAIVAAASAAPSIHNSQPWRFRLDARQRVFEVFAAEPHTLPDPDLDARAVHLSVGAALCNLAAAAAHLGWEPVVRLLPRPDVPGLLATVRLAGAPRAARLRRSDLYRAIWRRRSSRLPFSPTPVPEAVLAELAEAVRFDGAELHRPGRAERTRLLGLTSEAEERATACPARRAESLRWLATPGGATGLPAYALGLRDSAGHLPMRGFAGPPDALPRGRAEFEPDPQLFLLTTRLDRPVDWLRAGQALQHALLLLTLHGLRASMMHQALEWPDLRSRMAGAEHEQVTPQMLLRIGYGPAGFPTPRHPTTALLERTAAPSAVRTPVAVR
ncbi:nitroreductase family protein [Kitasatospora sp. NPDC097643]|uniref:Acg family FMN-binding oxidoreductase n=1 Tax=Kitasatospora sp. NPDC097643 TaxID=3157230 RepID=UPI0033221C24